MMMMNETGQGETWEAMTPASTTTGRATSASSRSDRNALPACCRSLEPRRIDRLPVLSCPALSLLPLPLLAFDKGRRRRTLRSGLATSGSTHMTGRIRCRKRMVGKKSKRVVVVTRTAVVIPGLTRLRRSSREANKGSASTPPPSRTRWVEVDGTIDKGVVGVTAHSNDRGCAAKVPRAAENPNDKKSCGCRTTC
jgi:hypothetical protein